MASWMPPWSIKHDRVPFQRTEKVKCLLYSPSSESTTEIRDHLATGSYQPRLPLTCSRSNPLLLYYISTFGSDGARLWTQLIFLSLLHICKLSRDTDKFKNSSCARVNENDWNTVTVIPNLKRMYARGEKFGADSHFLLPTSLVVVFVAVSTIN